MSVPPALSLVKPFVECVTNIIEFSGCKLSLFLSSLGAPLLAIFSVVIVATVLLIWNSIKRRSSAGAARERRTSSGNEDVVKWKTLFNLAKSAHIRENRQTLVQEIEKASIDVNGYQEPDTGLTLLLCACLSGETELVKFLIEKGADCKALTSHGDSALLLATYACCTVKSASTSLIDLLACRGLNINAQNLSGDLPLTIAALHGKTCLTSVLLQYGADPCIPNANGILPVDFAGVSGNFEAAKLLESANHSRYHRTTLEH